MENEKVTERYLGRRVHQLGGASYKWVSPGCAGVPDRIVIAPGGRVVFVEVKSEGQKSTPQQRRRQSELRALGCTVFADIDTKAKVDAVLEEMMPHEI